MKVYFKIYKLFHPFSNKFYIGKTIDVTRRLGEHLREKPNTKKSAWIKSLKIRYNDIPLIQIIHDNIDGLELANSYEKSWIEYYRNNYSKDNVLNMTDGGDGILGWIPSLETKQKMSRSHKGKIPNYIFKKGQKADNRKFNDSQILKIRKLYLNGISMRSISRQLKVDSSTIRGIIHRKIYKEI